MFFVGSGSGWSLSDPDPGVVLTDPDPGVLVGVRIVFVKKVGYEYVFQNRSEPDPYFLKRSISVPDLALVPIRIWS